MDSGRQWLMLGVMGALMALAGVAMLVMSRIFGPKRPRDSKLDPYECGAPVIGSSRDRFSVKFYLIAIFFILFDIETVFLIPWAVTQTESARGWAGFALMLVFVLVLAFALIYVWAKGALEWETGTGQRKGS